MEGGALVVNGELVPAGRPVIAVDNRAYRYGDGLFESIRVVNGQPCFIGAHWARLTEALKVLRINCPDGLNERTLKAHIERLVVECGHASARIRLTVYRDAPGHYRPEGNNSGYTIALTPLSSANYILNHEGLVTDIWPEMRKQVNRLSSLKTLNGQLYVMAGLWCMDRGLDDCLLQNDKGNIIESGSGNVFIVSNGVLYTPPLSDGCIGGVMRMQVINLAVTNGIKVYETSLNPQNLLAADELIMTNAVRGPQWAAAYRTKRYTHRMALHLVDLLVKSIA
ncbi:MAG: aminotransferase class IV [Bacteroidetes bacterium]|jgi:branched-chain amino acid aminotransferase|nr:aminotransferase class IV [Bacteroidota bacterium]MBX7130798.1 aminotransferase class IV [Flavobacteriales bacterium]MCC6655184.1 aminotransferase class IV [Flavobacteriales bacterium]HMU12702.1 aminotransferase class IV [Flavobacteriales bacterium]HNA34073.1 aminotransferase class IV [Flavobacteriales bacterium]